MGYVPVVNRGQRDIESNKQITAALEHERAFFEGHPAYQNKAQFCGTPFLARKLNIVRIPFTIDTLCCDDGLLTSLTGSHAPYPSDTS